MNDISRDLWSIGLLYAHSARRIAFGRLICLLVIGFSLHHARRSVRMQLTNVVNDSDGMAKYCSLSQKNTSSYLIG